MVSPGCCFVFHRRATVTCADVVLTSHSGQLDLSSKAEQQELSSGITLVACGARLQTQPGAHAELLKHHCNVSPHAEACDHLGAQVWPVCLSPWLPSHRATCNHLCVPMQRSATTFGGPACLSQGGPVCLSPWLPSHRPMQPLVSPHAEECDHLVAKAGPRLTRSGVVDADKQGGEPFSDIRTSSGMFFDRGEVRRGLG